MEKDRLAELVAAVRELARGLGINEERTASLMLDAPKSPPVVSRQEKEGGFWDANDVAAFLKVSRSWVYKRAESGELPHRRIGGLLRFEPDAIRAYARGEKPDAKVFSLVRGK